MIERRRLIGLGLAAALALGGLTRSTPATAQTDASGAGHLDGRVLGDDGAPLPGATVTVTSAEIDTGDATVQTDSQGEFALGPVRPGLYDLAVELAGYRDGSLSTLSVRDGQPTHAEIVLQRRAPGEGGY